MVAEVGQSRRQFRAAGSCEGYTRSWLRYATCTRLPFTGKLTPCRLTNTSPPSCCDQPWMPPRGAQKDASTACTEGSACVEQPLLPQLICPVTLKLPAASSQYSSYCAFGSAPAQNVPASMPMKVLILPLAISRSERRWRVYCLSLPPAFTTE